MLDSQTKQRINNARQVLVGKIPDPKSQVEQITTALIYKFMDDMDRENEEIGRKANFLVNELAEFSWSKLMSNQVSGDERWNLYTRALETFAKSKQIPELFRTIFKSAYLPYRDAQTLNLFLKEINEFTYDHSEKLGDAFEYLLSVLGSQGDAGQFRTPRHLIDFIVEVVAPKKNERILDPACGTAGFLISAYKHIQKYNSSSFDPEKSPLPFEHIKSKDVTELTIQDNGKYKGDKLSPDDRNKLSQNIHGYDIAPEMVRLSLVNMYLHGFVTPKIQEYDTLTFEDKWDEHFDVILANPPFMTPKGGIRPHKRFSVNANRAEVLFVDYIAEHLSIKGRAGIIVPEGIIFQSANAYKSLRKHLVENWGLHTVVSLPAGVFQPYSGVKTSVLFLDKEIAKKTDEILFVKVENDGFDLATQRRKIEKNDLPSAFKVLKKWKESQEVDKNEKNSVVVEKSKIAESGDYNLTGDRYREAIDCSNTKWKMVKLGEVCENIRGVTFAKKEQLYKETNDTIKVATTKASQENGIVGKDLYIIPSKLVKKDNQILKYGDILISIANSLHLLGRTTFIEKEFEGITFGAFMGLIRGDKSIINNKYLNSVLKSPNAKVFFESHANTTTNISNMPASVLVNFTFPLPPLKIQEQIAEEIEGYQKIINGAKQVVENWKPKIKIDPEWEMAELGKVYEMQNGRAFKKEEWKSSGIPIIRIANLNSENAQYNYFDGEYNKRIEVNNNDLLFSWSGTIGTSFGPHYWTRGKGVLNQHIYKFKAKLENIDKKFAFTIIQSMVPMIEEKAHGMGGLVHITKSELSQFKIPIPPLSVQKEIVEKIEVEQRIIDQNKKLIEIYEGKIKERIGEVWGE